MSSAPDRRSGEASGLQRLLRARELGIAGLLALLMLFMAWRSPAFLTADNLLDVGMDCAVLVLVAIGMMLVILTGGIDISVGSTMALSGMTVGLVLMANPGLPPAAAVALGAGVGVAAGGINGGLIVLGKVPPVIATLGTMSIFRGLTFILCYAFNGGKSVSGFPRSFAYLGCGYLGRSPIPFSLVAVAALAVVMGLILHQTRFGRMVYALGRNERTCYASGIPVARIKTLLFTLSGIFSGVAGSLRGVERRGHLPRARTADAGRAD